MTRATQKEQATTTLITKLLKIFWTFYQRNLRLSFLDWEPKRGDKNHHTVLSSVTGLESPKSIASHEHLVGFVFVNRQSGFHLFCVQAYDPRFALHYQFPFRFLNLLFLVCWMKTSASHVKWRGVENWKLLLSHSLICIHTKVCTKIVEHVELKVFKLWCR